MAVAKVLSFVGVLQILFLTAAEANLTALATNVLETAARAVPSCIFGVESIEFFLFTRENRQGQIIPYNTTDIPVSNDSNCGFGVHGFISDANTTEQYQLYMNWLDAEDASIFAVNWATAACSGNFTLTDILAYGSAVQNTRTVGEYVANFIRRLHDAGKCRIDKLRIVGHSLGAHVSGFAAKHIFRLTELKVPLLIGMDPAGFLFQENPCEERLCKTDAQYVQAIHTTRLLGFNGLLGHVDFFVNEAIHQPGCLLVTCSHTRAVTYMKNSIRNNCSFVGTASPLDSISDCTAETCNAIGFQAPTLPASGKLYVRVTSRTDPFCNAVN